MPTANEIDRACKQGLFCYVSNRQQILGAVDELGKRPEKRGQPAKAGFVWVNMRRTGLWEEVPMSKVMITTEYFSKEKKMEVVDATKPAKRSGKRGSGEHTGLPSDSAKRAASKDKEPAGNGADKGADAKAKRLGATTVTVSRTTAKQGELPGVQTSKRKIQEIETLAEELETRKDEKKAADDRFKDAEENLIVSMKKHDRLYYSRSTWGSVEIKEAKTSAKFKREKSKAKG